MKIQCINIRCQGCVDKIQVEFSDKYPEIKISIEDQTVEIEADDKELINIRSKLSQMGFLPNQNFIGRIKNFFNKG